MKNINKIRSTIEDLRVLTKNLKSNSAISYLYKAIDNLSEAIKEEEFLK